MTVSNRSTVILSFLSGLAVAVLSIAFLAYVSGASVDEYERESLIDGKNDLTGGELPADINELESFGWEGDNAYVLSNESNHFLDENAFVLMPDETRAEAERSVYLPDSDEISIVFRAINGALLVDTPAYWLGRDCGKSILKMRIEGYKSGSKAPVVKEKEVKLDSKEKMVEFDVSEFRGGRADIYLKPDELPGDSCGVRNEAVFVRELFIKHRDGLMPTGGL